MLTKVRFNPQLEFSDSSRYRTSPDLSPLSAFQVSPSNRGFRQAEDTWRQWASIPKEIRQPVKKKLNFNCLYKGLQSRKPVLKTVLSPEDILNITDSFQHRTVGLLEEHDFVTTGLLQPKSMSPSMGNQVKVEDQLLENPTPTNKKADSGGEIRKIRRKSDVSSWSGGISSLETRTLFLAYKNPRVELLKKLQASLEPGKTPKNSKKRGVTDVPRQKKLVPQKSFSSYLNQHEKGIRRDSQGMSTQAETVQARQSADIKEEDQLGSSPGGEAGELNQKGGVEKRENGDYDSKEKELMNNEEQGDREGDKDLTENSQTKIESRKQSKKKKKSEDLTRGHPLIERWKPKTIRPLKASMSIHRKNRGSKSSNSPPKGIGYSHTIDKAETTLYESQQSGISSQQNKTVGKASPYDCKGPLFSKIQKRLSKKFFENKKMNLMLTNHNVPAIGPGTMPNTTSSVATESKSVTNGRKSFINISGQGSFFSNTPSSLVKKPVLPPLNQLNGGNNSNSSSSQHKRIVSLRQAQVQQEGNSFSKEKSLMNSKERTFSKQKTQEILVSYSSASFKPIKK